MSNFLGGFPTFTQLPPITGVTAFVGDMAYTADDGVFWTAVQPSAPPGAVPVWSYIDTLRGATGPEGPPGVGVPGPAGQMGLTGAVGPKGPQGPAGKNSFSYTQTTFNVPPIGTTRTLAVTDSSWMLPGTLVFIPGAGTFTCVGTPSSSQSVNIVNSGDPHNAPVGSQIGGGAVISPASLRGPAGPQGVGGPSGPPGPQGVSGTSVYSTLTQPFTIPATSGIAFVQDATAFGAGQIVYVQGGEYFSVTATDTVAKTLTLQNQNYPGGKPPGTLIPVGNTVSGTGPQGPQGPQGVQGPQGIQGIVGVAPTGAVFMWPMITPPGGYLLCDGQSYDRTAYSGLFSILGTTYGSVDANSFSVPDLRGRFPLGVNASHPIGTDPATSRAGEESHALTVSELASHIHNATQGTHTHGDSGHQHYCANVNHLHMTHGVNHLHNMDHYHGVPSGQFNHAHTVQLPFSGTSTYSGGSSANHSPYSSGNTPYGVDAAVIPAGITNYASQQNGAWVNTGAADRSLDSWSDAADRNLAFWSNVASAAISTESAGPITIASQGGGAPHNTMPPYQTLNFIIKT